MWQLTTAINGTELGPWALDVLLKATILLALAGLAATLLRRAPAATRHVLWAASLLGTLLILLASAAPGWHVLPALHRAAETPSPLAQAINSLPPRGGDIVAPSTPETLAPRSAEVPLPVRLPVPTALPANPPPTPIATAPVPALVVTTPSRPAPSPAPLNLSARSIPWTSCLLLLWAAGVAALLAPLALAIATLHQLRKTATPVQLNEALKALEAVKAVMGIRGKIHLLASDACAVPMTFGILRPRILVPTSSTIWPAARWRMILTHELAHIRRRDIAIMLLAQFARAVYWFHPLAWVAYSQMGIESEKACDDAVLATGQEPHTYAAVLLEIAEGSRNRSLMKFAVLHMARRSTLETRVRSVLVEGRRRRASSSRMIALASVVMLLSAGIGLLRAADANHPSETMPKLAAPGNLACTVLGNVRQQGIVTLPAGKTIGDALIQAGLRDADPRQLVSLYAHQRGVGTIWTKPLTDARATVLSDGDVIVVEKETDASAGTSIDIRPTTSGGKPAVQVSETSPAGAPAAQVTAESITLSTRASTISDAEVAAALAIAKDRADDTTAVDAEKTIRDDKQLQYQRLQKSPGAVPQAELDAARMDVVVAAARVKLAEHSHQQEILAYTLAKAQAAAGHPITGVSVVSDSRAVAEAASDAEADAALAIAKDKADDTSMLTGGQAILDQKKASLAIIDQKVKTGLATAEDLNAAKTEVVLAQSQADAAQHQHQQAILAYTLAKAQYDARKAAAIQKH